MDESQGYEPILIYEQTGQTFSLATDLVTIGRKTGNTIVLGNDLKVSRHHATISRQDDTYILHDVGSANGTYLNEVRLTMPRKLENGDLIQIGEATFRVKLPLADTEPALMFTPPAPAAAPLESKTEAVPGKSARERTDTAISSPAPAEPVNPYVGPRTFTQEEGHLFFGRDVEARELMSLIISERLVLFYAQSGAGKSSLINARLIPQLRESGYAVLPVGRVSGALPAGIDEVENIYVFNLLLSLDESDGDPQRFVQMKLTDFLKNLTSLDGRHYYYDETLRDDQLLMADNEEFEQLPYILIIDQFEELITTYPGRWQDREDFFLQLTEAMTNDPLLWVVLTLREDYVAALDPYIHLVPGHLRARFYMQRMGHEAALEAVRRPAEDHSRPFAGGVAENLVNNLRQIRTHATQSPSQTETQLGQFVEPVQLQVVCYQLWKNLQDQTLGPITQHDLDEMGDVDEALGQFYEQTLAEVVRATGVTEISLRNWFETQLITEAGTRGAVYQGLEETGGIPNEAVDMLVRRFLLRSEVRTGGTWYELIHDRLINPIMQANQKWRLDQPLIQLAHGWIESGRSESKLLEGQPLWDALATNWQGLGPEVEEFLRAGQTAQEAREEALQLEQARQREQQLLQAQALAEEQRKRAESEAQAAMKLRRRAWLLGGFVLAALLMATAAIGFALQANWNAARAREEQAKAIAAQNRAEAEATISALTANYAGEIIATQTALAALDLAEGDKLATAQALAATRTSLEATIAAAATAAEETAEAEDETMGETVPLPTETPTGTPIPVAPAASPTPTDTPAATATPNLDATATAEARLAELSQVIEQQESLIVEIPASPPSPPATCRVMPHEAFLPLWEKHRDRLGCPQAETINGFFAEQPFERGFMLWSETLDEFFVAIGNEYTGVWERLNRADFNPEAAGCEPSIPKTAPILVQPVRGFGAIWCSRLDIQQRIGYARAPEHGVNNNLIQRFEGGFMIRDSRDTIYILFTDADRTYIRVGG